MRAAEAVMAVGSQLEKLKGKDVEDIDVSGVYGALRVESGLPYEI